MQWPTLTQDEQQELWNTLEVLMHGATVAELRCAQQRLETMTSRQRPYLAPTIRTLVDHVVQAAICASQGGEQRFYWLEEVESRWNALIGSLHQQARCSDGVVSGNGIVSSGRTAELSQALEASS
ncbi:hypothetical protein [Hydrocarboniclastica marina]|uniref:Uncharacterized protein n=1 Tax=Hydrocarboniclastica marina TaxID=2259620 RepID=A0A4P7XGE0_9ALTE|nr:hypothetical protein [Hydrocarboniclastica marina]QCF25775.1 hypothetical protein soil367_07505 [Hydrocarboniclastica marina]